MKKVLVLLMASLSVFTSGCSKDDDPIPFNYPLEVLYGTWEGTGVYVNGNWIDPTSSWLYEDMRFSITFYPDGKYYGEGSFGTGHGTYNATGDTILTYVDGEFYLKYIISSLLNNKAELTMIDSSGDSLRIRVTKKN